MRESREVDFKRAAHRGHCVTAFGENNRGKKGIVVEDIIGEKTDLGVKKNSLKMRPSRKQTTQRWDGKASSLYI